MSGIAMGIAVAVAARETARTVTTMGKCIIKACWDSEVDVSCTERGLIEKDSILVGIKIAKVE